MTSSPSGLQLLFFPCLESACGEECTYVYVYTNILVYRSLGHWTPSQDFWTSKAEDQTLQLAGSAHAKLAHWGWWPVPSLVHRMAGLQITVQFSLVAQSCLTLCDPMDCSISGFPVHHQLPELTQTHVHCIGEAIQQYHPLSSPSSPTFNHSQHHGLFKWVSSLHQVARVLEFQL